MTLMRKIFFLLMLPIMLAACSQKPVDIHYGNDECVYCKMMITDRQFATQIVTEKGKAYKFDSIECLVAYHRENSEELQNAALWVSSYDNPGKWLKAKDAQYVKSEVVNSPMGAALLAFSSKRAAKKHLEEKPGELLLWSEVYKTKMPM